MDSGEKEGVRVEEENGRGSLRRNRRASTKLANYVDPPTDDDEDEVPKRKGQNGGYRARKKTAKEDDEGVRVEDVNGDAGLVKEKRATTKIGNRKDPITDQVEASGSKPMEEKGNRARKRTKKNDEIDGEVSDKSIKKPKKANGCYLPVSDFSVKYELCSSFVALHGDLCIHLLYVLGYIGQYVPPMSI